MADSVSTFSGNVIALSFDERVGACSATLSSGQSMTFSTAEPRMQSLLESAWMKGFPITVDYEPSENNELVSVSISSS
jgi:uncharacterized protein YaiE (UPF0345 family)